MAHELIQVNSDLELRALRPNDAPALFALIDGSRKYLAQYLPWPKHTQSVADSEGFIELMMRQRLAGNEYGFGLWHRGALAGHISIMHLNEGRPEIGYWVAESFTGQGIASVATHALTGYAHAQLGIETIIIRAEPANIPSNRVAEKAGYKHVGTATDEHGTVFNEWVSHGV